MLLSGSNCEPVIEPTNQLCVSMLILLMTSAVNESSGRHNRENLITYFAFGLHNNPNNQRIEQALGIAPSQWIKSLYTISLAERSPAEAIVFLNTVRPAKDQRYIAGKITTK